MKEILNTNHIILYAGLAGTEYFAVEGLKKISVFVILTALVVTLGIPTNAYAMDKSGNMRWQLIFLSPYGGCTNYQYQMTNAYDEMTSKYFELYKFANSNYQPQCISDKKYTNYKVPDDVDLLILVYDNEIGKKELHGSNIGGLYNHVGTDKTRNHTIIICDCSNFEYSDPAWSLSHELSHFVTYYLGFDQSVVEDKIHSLDYKYDQCTEGNWNTDCFNGTTHIYGNHYFTKAAVMTPYQPAIGMKLIRAENVPSSTIVNRTSDATEMGPSSTAMNGTTNLADIGPGSAITDEPSNATGVGTSDATNIVADSQVVMNLQKEFTKLWLAGSINDTEYTKVLGFMVDKSGGVLTTEKQPTNFVLFDGPDGIKENSTYYDSGLEQKLQNSLLLKRVPFKPDNTTNSSDKIQIPQWFKSRAYMWAQDQVWSDKDFVTSVKSLLNPNH